MKNAFITLAEVREKRSGTPAGTTSVHAGDALIRVMNSHFQSSETPWISSGGLSDANGLRDRGQWDPIQARPPGG